MTHILHRSANAELPVAVGGKGIELFDQRGASYIDASGGAAVSCLGHGHPDVIAALHKQLDSIAYAHTAFFTTEIAEKLADRLIETAPEGIDHVYLVSGGSEAVEAALKMARQYFVEKGEPQRRHIIARRQSYHGNTLGALATGGNEWRRAQFQPLLIETHHIDPCYAYRSNKGKAMPPMRGVLQKRSKTRSSNSAQTRSSPSLRRRSLARPQGRCRRWRTISNRSGRSAIATACCSSLMK
jgi:adenosylmethionine-8-amino-7-oxononanoate aminotransferase